MIGDEHTTLSRRGFMTRALAGSSVLLGGKLLTGGGAAAGQQIAVPPARASAVVDNLLPNAAQVRRDYQRMVDFGPRLTGSAAHNRFIDWLESEFERAGCLLLPHDQHKMELWEVDKWSLDLLDGLAAGPVRVAAYLPRSKETPSGGVTGKLVYGGSAPAPSLTGVSPSELQANLERYGRELADWVRATLTVRADQVAGNIVLIDLPYPPQLTESFFYSEMNYYHWSGHTPDPTRDYKRMFLAEVGPDSILDALAGFGPAGVVFSMDASYAALKGQYVPFDVGFKPLPALFVDRDTGGRLRAASAATPKSRLTLTASRKKTTSPSIVAILPGQSDEVLVVNTHTDGQNAFEENCGVAQVHLARYFSSLPRSRQLKRTLVFSAVTGHMSGQLPETKGFIDDHPDLVACAAAAMTIEHFGCQEWVDSLARGYYRTGDPEATAVWTSQSGILSPAIDSIVENDLPHTIVLRPKPLYLGIGGAFQDAGVPNASLIAGPNYLVAIADNGHMDKLDAELAARQTRWSADLLTRLDGTSAQDLATGDAALTRRSVGKCALPASATAATAHAGGQSLALLVPVACASRTRRLHLRLKSTPLKGFKARHRRARIERVSFYIDDKLRATRRKPPYETRISVGNLAPGRHVARVRVVLARTRTVRGRRRTTRITLTLKARFTVC